MLPNHLASAQPLSPFPYIVCESPGPLQPCVWHADECKGNGMAQAVQVLTSCMCLGVLQGIVGGRDMTSGGKADLHQLHGLFARGLMPGGIAGAAAAPSLVRRGRHARLGCRAGPTLFLPAVLRRHLLSCCCLVASCCVVLRRVACAYCLASIAPCFSVLLTEKVRADWEMRVSCRR